MDNRNIKRKVMKELGEGYELATQLQVLLHEPKFDKTNGLGSANELVGKILKSFGETISALSSCESVKVYRSQHDDASGDDSALRFCHQRAEVSGESLKRMRSNKGKRGSYRRKNKSDSWKVVSATLEDDHAWRKYGQKEILNAKHPRSYFRCTHKFTQGCKAIKQVQKLNDDAKMHQITYIGNHTCNSEMTKTETVETITGSDSYIASSEFSYENQGEQQEQDPRAPMIKQEETVNDQNDLSEDLSIVWKDFASFEESELMYSCNEINSHGLDMELVVSSSSALGLGSHFYFDGNELSFQKG